MSLFKFPKTNIFQSLLPFYYICKLLGHVAFSFQGDATKGIIELTIVDIVCVTCSFLASGYCLYLSVLFGFKRSTSIVLDIGAYFVINGILLLTVVSLGFHNLLRHRICQLVSTVHKCDEKLQQLGSPVDANQVFWTTLSVTIGALGVTGGLVAFSFYFTQALNDVNDLISVSLAHIHFVIISCMFMLAVYTIYVRFSTLNTFIFTKFLLGKSGGILEVKPKNATKENRIIIREIRIIHDTLTDMVSEINFCFSFQMMWAAAVSFCFTLVTFFAGYRVVAASFDSVLFLGVLNNSVWSLFYVLFTLCAIAMCSLTTREGNGTSALVHKVINIIDDPEAVEMLRLFSMQLNHRPPVLSCGLFPFDWTLLYSIVSASATYIVILIQFELSLPPAGTSNATLT